MDWNFYCYKIFLFVSSNIFFVLRYFCLILVQPIQFSCGYCLHNVIVHPFTFSLFVFFSRAFILKYIKDDKVKRLSKSITLYLTLLFRLLCCCRIHNTVLNIRSLMINFLFLTEFGAKRWFFSFPHLWGSYTIFKNSQIFEIPIEQYTKGFIIINSDIMKCLSSGIKRIHLLKIQ